MSPQSKLTKYKKLSLPTLALTTIAGIVLFVFLTESNLKYFSSSPLSMICYAVIILAAALSVSACFLLKNSGNIDISACTRPKYLHLTVAFAAAYVFLTTGKQLVATPHNLISRQKS
jgi:hypothetical protein